MGARAYSITPESPRGLVLGACQDRVNVRDDARWRVNARNGFLEAMIPLTWQGRRDYHNVLGRDVIRVLHRAEQVQAPTFMRALHRLPVAPGHPMQGRQSVDIDTSNAAQFVIGFVGDTITLATVPLMDGTKVIGECQVPAGKVSIHDEGAIKRITDPRDPHTQTSLGYLPLWAPPAEDEIAGEVNGEPFGIWQSPCGPIAYDREHILDADDPRVRALAEAKPEFNPESMGPNHLAAVLKAGRGDQASELLRLVDCRDAAGHRTHFFYSHAATDDGDPKVKTMSNEALQALPLVPVRVCDFSSESQKVLARRGISLPFTTLDMPNEELAAKLKMIMGQLGMVVEALGAAEQETEAMQGERDVEMGLREKAEGEKMKAEEMATAAQDALAKLQAEVAPLRKQALDAVKLEGARLLGITDPNDAEQTAKLPEAVRTGDTAAAVKRAVIVALNANDAAVAAASDDYIAGAYTAEVRRMKTETPADAGSKTPKAAAVIDVANASPFGSAVKSGSAPARPPGGKPSPLRAAINGMNGRAPASN